MSCAPRLVPLPTARARCPRGVACRLQHRDLTRRWLDEPQHLRRGTAVRCAAPHRRLRAADRRPPPPTWASPTTRLRFQVNKKGGKLPSFQGRLVERFTPRPVQRAFLVVQAKSRRLPKRRAIQQRLPNLASRVHEELRYGTDCPVLQSHDSDRPGRNRQFYRHYLKWRKIRA